MDPRRLLPWLAGAAVLSVLLTGWVLLRPAALAPSGPVASSPAPAVRSMGPSPAAEPFARRVLRVWDERRAAAWAQGDPAMLRALYVPGSRTGARDAARLEDYADRSLRVRGLRTQVLALDVLDRAPGRLVLRVTDRVVGGEVVGSGTAIALPFDQVSTRRLVLRRVEGRWLMVRVGQPRA